MHVLVTGGTGSVGSVLVETLLKQDHTVRVFSRDETKQYEMRHALQHPNLRFQIGDVRNFISMREAVRGIDTIFHCAAMKHVPSCEASPFEAVRTNVMGTQNLIDAVYLEGGVETVVAISTDKACDPVGVMGTTKRLMEKLITQANFNYSSNTRYVCVRFGNVVPSRGSVFPFFLKLIEEGKPLTVTCKHMTRFLLPLHRVSEVLLHVATHAEAGEIWAPDLPSAYINDIADVLREDKDIPIQYIGMRPGEKLHELLVSEEEASRTRRTRGYFVIAPPGAKVRRSIDQAVSSRYGILDKEKLHRLLDTALKEIWRL